MADYRFATVGPSEAGSRAQWRAFVEDPFDDGSVVYGTLVDGEFIYETGVTVHEHRDDNGGRRYDLRLTGPRANDDIAGDRFRVLGASGTRLMERRIPLYDGETQIGDQVIASADLTVRQWRNIILITGPDDELEYEVDEDGNPTTTPTGRPSPWPNEMIEHFWI